MRLDLKRQNIDFLCCFGPSQPCQDIFSGHFRPWGFVWRKVDFFDFPDPTVSRVFQKVKKFKKSETDVF